MAITAQEFKNYSNARGNEMTLEEAGYLLEQAKDEYALLDFKEGIEVPEVVQQSAIFRMATSISMGGLANYFTIGSTSFSGLDNNNGDNGVAKLLKPYLKYTSGGFQVPVRCV